MSLESCLFFFSKNMQRLLTVLAFILLSLSLSLSLSLYIYIYIYIYKMLFPLVILYVSSKNIWVTESQLRYENYLKILKK